MCSKAGQLARGSVLVTRQNVEQSVREEGSHDGHMLPLQEAMAQDERLLVARDREHHHTEAASLRRPA